MTHSKTSGKRKVDGVSWAFPSLRDAAYACAFINSWAYRWLGKVGVNRFIVDEITWRALNFSIYWHIYTGNFVWSTHQFSMLYPITLLDELVYAVRASE